MERHRSFSSNALLDAFSSATSQTLSNAPSSSPLHVPQVSVPRHLDFDHKRSHVFFANPPAPAISSHWLQEPTPHGRHEKLSDAEKHKYDLSRAQLKASSRTSALLGGFAMVALVELQYDSSTPKGILIVLGVVTAFLVSVHLLALMMSTCILPYLEASGPTQDSPHNELKFYIDLSWFFSTCIGLILFLVEIGIIFYVKFQAIGFEQAGWVTSAILIPVLFIFVMISCFIHRSRASHSRDETDRKVSVLKQLLDSSEQNIKLV